MLAAIASKTQITKMVGENIQLYIPTISETYIYRGLGLGCMAFFMFVVVAVNLSKVVRFYIKYYLYNSMYLVLGVVCIPFMLMSPGDPDNVSWASLFTSMSVKYLFGIRVSAKGLEHLESEQPYIIVGNHQSTIDHISMMEIWPKRCTIMMKKSLKYAGPFGLAAILSGCIFVDRSSRVTARQALDDTIKTIKKKKAKIWMFPEGTRSLFQYTKEPMLPFKKGAFNLAIEAQVPIVPVIFSSQDPFFSFREYRFNRGNIKIKVLPPISTIGLKSNDVLRLTDEVRKSMLDTFYEISEQPSPSCTK